MLPAEALGYFEAATARHLGFLMLARVDGKSPVEYLTEEIRRDQVRQTAKQIIQKRLDRLEDCFEVVLAGINRGLY